MDIARYKAILIALGAVAGIVCLAIFVPAYFVEVSPRLSPQEQQLAQYQYQEVEVEERKPLTFSGLRNPMTGGDPAVVNGKGYPPEALTQLAPAGGPPQDPGAGAQGVSMVVIKDRSRMAIVGGEVVKEGDRTRHGKVMRITKSGVLMKSEEGERWLYIE